MRKHLVIPDTQVTPTTPTDHLEWIGHYIVEQMPDVIIQLGDFADMESLSSYDQGRKAHEGRRYVNDIFAANKALGTLKKPIDSYNSKRKLYKEKQYKPEYHVTLGNHCQRTVRAVEADAKLEGVMSVDDIRFKDFGFTVHEFLEPVEIDGVWYCHYFANPGNGKPYSGLSMDTRLKNVGMTHTQGHQQIYLVGQRSLGNGKRLRGLVCGSCYLHDEDYRGKQGNSDWRGIFVKHEVVDGEYDLMEVSLDFLCRKYEGVRLHKFMKKKYPDIFNNSLWLQRQARKEGK